jgi:hypothetical protein
MCVPLANVDSLGDVVKFKGRFGNDDAAVFCKNREALQYFAAEDERICKYFNIEISEKSFMSTECVLFEEYSYYTRKD